MEPRTTDRAAVSTHHFMVGIESFYGKIDLNHDDLLASMQLASDLLDVVARWQGSGHTPTAIETAIAATLAGFSAERESKSEA